MSVAVLAGGVGAARFLNGLVQVLDPAEISVIVNTGDDLVMHSLYICPDLDTITYTLSGAGDRERGWGLSGESWNVLSALERFGTETWFGLGDKDLATHLYRTSRLDAGASLSEVTTEITRAFGLSVELIPMSDDPVRTQVELAEGGEVSFQEYFVKLRHDVALSSVRFVGAERARPAPRVLDALRDAETIIIAPSNPIVSIGPILAIAPISELIASRRDDVVAISPIVGGAALKGPADRMLVELGGESSVVGVADLLVDFASALVIDRVDAALAEHVEAAGMRALVTETVMSTPAISAELARVALSARRM